MENRAKTVTEVLKAAKWMLENVGWCQGQFSKTNKNGKFTAFCASGAIEHVYADFKLIDRAQARLEAVIGGGDIAYWNDKPERTLPQVLKVFDKAIKAKR